MTRALWAVQGAATHVVIAATLVLAAPPLAESRLGPHPDEATTFAPGVGQGRASSPEAPAQRPSSGTKQSGSRAEPIPDGEDVPLLGRCSGRGSPVTAAGLAHGLDQFREPSWKWADGGVSARLSDGRVLWFFGDTVREPTPKNGAVMVANSLLVSTGGCFDQALPTDQRDVLPAVDGPGGVRYPLWPTSVVALAHPGWDEVLVFSVVVRRTKGFWGFELGGTVLSRFVVPVGGQPRRVDQQRLTVNSFDPQAIGWGTGVVRRGSELFVFGTRREPGQLGRSVYLAKVPVNHVFDRFRWRYATTDGWGDEGVAAPVLSADPGVSHIVGAYAEKSQLVLVSKVGGDFGESIGVWHSDATRPAFRLASSTPRPFRTGETLIEYMPIVHAEYGTAGQLLLTMSRNSTKPGVVGKDWRLGRPDFFSITAPKLANRSAGK